MIMIIIGLSIGIGMWNSSEIGEIGDFDYGGPGDLHNQHNVSIWLSETVRVYYLDAFKCWHYEDKEANED